jgi:hypothetical protein
MSVDCWDRLIVKSTTLPKSKYLRQLYRVLEAGGYSVTSRGAPDFFAFKKAEGGELHFLAVEAVRKKSYRLRRHQRAVMEVLARCGVPCFRYNCDMGEFEEINFKPPRGVTPPGWREQWRKEQKER